MADIRQKIIDYLGQQTQGVHALEIADSIGHNRITVGKYLDVLLAEKKVAFRAVGKANLWSLSHNTKPKVLIVDDEESVVQLIELTLGDKNYDLLKAYNGQEGLQLVQQHMPQLIVLDVMMPVMDGFAMCKAIKENILTKDIIVILLTAKAEVVDKMRGIKAGADYYMTKPFDPSELEALVQIKLQQQDEQQQLHPITGFAQNGKPKDPALTVQIEGYTAYVEKNGFKEASILLKYTAKVLQSFVQAKPHYSIAHENDYTIHISYDGLTAEDKQTLQEQLTATLPFITASIQDPVNIAFHVQ